ncbi:hypothetical protein YB2330_003381 [Saitoella coloradoensis]
MASADTSSRLTLLFAASHSLALSSPSVAAHLMSQFLQHAEEKDVLLHESVKRKVCGGCGSLFLPGWNASVQTKDEKKKKRRRVVEGDEGKQRKMSKKRRREMKKKEVEGKRTKDELIRSKMVYSCRNCTRQATFEMECPAPTFASPLPLPPPVTASRSKLAPGTTKAAAKPSPSSAAVSLPSSARSSPAPTSNTPSPAGTPKKRKKGAKTGLQAMLAKSKQDQRKDAGGPGIMDFMSLM